VPSKTASSAGATALPVRSSSHWFRKTGRRPRPTVRKLSQTTPAATAQIAGISASVACRPHPTPRPFPFCLSEGKGRSSIRGRFRRPLTPIREENRSARACPQRGLAFLHSLIFRSVVLENRSAGGAGRTRTPEPDFGPLSFAKLTNPNGLASVARSREGGPGTEWNAMCLGTVTRPQPRVGRPSSATGGTPDRGRAPPRSEHGPEHCRTGSTFYPETSDRYFPKIHKTFRPPACTVDIMDHVRYFTLSRCWNKLSWHIMMDRTFEMDLPLVRRLHR
jgi:hypothetical protein